MGFLDRSVVLAGQAFSAILPLVMVLSSISPQSGGDSPTAILGRRLGLKPSDVASLQAAIAPPPSARASIGGLGGVDGRGVDPARGAGPAAADRRWWAAHRGRLRHPAPPVRDLSAQPGGDHQEQSGVLGVAFTPFSWLSACALVVVVATVVGAVLAEDPGRLGRFIRAPRR